MKNAVINAINNPTHEVQDVCYHIDNVPYAVYYTVNGNGYAVVQKGKKTHVAPCNSAEDFDDILAYYISPVWR